MDPGALAQVPPALPFPLMHREHFTKGQVLFRIGDRADRLFYIYRGAIRLPEVNRVVRAGEFVGELGVFSPLKKRTATAICEEDLEVYTMGQAQVLELFRHDPAMAFSLMQLGIKRLIEDLKAETEASERNRSELRIAHDIQTSMLPRAFPALPERTEFEMYGIMDPAREVGGDFYDYFAVGKRKLYLIVGDASGKGIPAALFMAISKALLKSEAQRGFSPGRVLSRVNNLLCPENQRCMFVTVCCLLLDLQTGEVQCCTGGHEPPLLCRANGTVEHLSSPAGMALGVVQNARYASRRTFLKPGDSLILYTDGVTDAVNARQEPFSIERFLACVARQRQLPLRELIEQVRAEVGGHAQEQPKLDDLTLLAVRYKGSQKSQTRRARPRLHVRKVNGASK